MHVARRFASLHQSQRQQSSIEWLVKLSLDIQSVDRCFFFFCTPPTRLKSCLPFQQITVPRAKQNIQHRRRVFYHKKLKQIPVKCKELVNLRQNFIINHFVRKQLNFSQTVASKASWELQILNAIKIMKINFVYPVHNLGVSSNTFYNYP